MSNLNSTEFAGKIKEVSQDALKRLDEPHMSNVNLISFPQTWPNTSCGHGGMAGQSVCVAQTVMVDNLKNVCVYFGWKFAYKLPCRAEGLWKYVSDRGLPCVKQAKSEWGEIIEIDE
jgi:hypothetical protein